MHRKERVLLVNSPFAGIDIFFPPMDHAYFKSILSSFCDSVSSIDLNIWFSKGRLFNGLDNLCDSVLPSKITRYMKKALDLISDLDVNLVVLPYHLSIDSKDTILFSYIVKREIERDFPSMNFLQHGSFCKRTEASNTPFLLSLIDDHIDKFFSLPCADFNDYSLKEYRSNFLPIQTLAGCPNSCVFCTQVERRYGSKCCLHRPVREVLSELQEQSRRHNVDSFFFRDDNIAANPVLPEIVSEIRKKGLDIVWGGESDLVADLNLLSDMQKAGCRFLLFGLETGSASLRKKMRKKYDLTMCERFLRMASSYGINVHCYLISNHPFESSDDVRQTLEFLSKNHDFITGILIQDFFLNNDSYIGKHPMDFQIDNLVETRYELRLGSKAKELALRFGVPEVLSYPNDCMNFLMKSTRRDMHERSLRTEIESLGIPVHNSFIQMIDSVLALAR